MLLAAVLIASGKLINSTKTAPPEKDYASKLAELRADLTNAAKAGYKQPTSSSKRTTTRRSPKTRPS
jgi:hypothetical protein